MCVSLPTSELFVVNIYQRFATLSKYLPFLPAFGGGTARFQPVFVDDIAKAVEIISRRNRGMDARVAGKIFEAGGPESEKPSLPCA